MRNWERLLWCWEGGGGAEGSLKRRRVNWVMSFLVEVLENSREKALWLWKSGFASEGLAASGRIGVFVGVSFTALELLSPHFLS